MFILMGVPLWYIFSLHAFTVSIYTFLGSLIADLKNVNISVGVSLLEK